MVSVSASPTKIEVSASTASIGVSLSSTPVSATVAGGPGPTGPAGPAGAQTVSGLTDVVLDGLQDGDLLRYDAGAWKNRNEKQLTDGGNFSGVVHHG